MANKPLTCAANGLKGFGMCKGCKNCPCSQVRTLAANLLPSESKIVNYLGRRMLVVPLIMARADVVMNGARVPVEEMSPEAWNGRPVTVGHPDDGNGGFISATASPEIHEQWSVGTLFNAHVDEEGALRAEAWIDIERCNERYPGLIGRIKSSEEIDVSTGYFCEHEEQEGELNGRKYNVVHRNIKPDHLALLPDEQGACSWEDGCGVRANQDMVRIRMKKKAVANATKAIDAISKGVASLQASLKGLVRNERGEDDDPSMLIADLLSDDRSPFLPDDEIALRQMSVDTLKKMRATFLQDDDESEETNEEEEEKPAEDNQDDDEEGAKNKRKSSVKNSLVTADDIRSIVKDVLDKHPALQAANAAAKQRKLELVDHVCSTSSIPRAVAETMTEEQLEAVVASLATTFVGRPVPAVVNSDKKDPIAEAMTAPSVIDFIKNRKEVA